MPHEDYTYTYSYPEDSQEVDGAISSPDLSKSSLKPRVRSIKDAEQAKSIIDVLENANRERNKKNARIAAKYNSERPYDQSCLEAEGLGWKSNFTTSPLVLLIDKVAPRFLQAIDGVKYLTNSAFPETVSGANKKTEAFRREVTKTIRARPGWKNFVSELAQENALYGFTSVAWLDEFSWFPRHFRQDSFYVPDGTKQLPDDAQIVVLKETLLIHELFELIKDKKAAETRGWDVGKTVVAINSAMPAIRRSRETNPERIYEDLIRESNVGVSYEAGARVVALWHLFATEIDGKISHYIYNGDKDFAELFSSEDQYKKMSEAVAFFSFQLGNGTLHGSKGIGRQIYAMAGILDRNRNEVVDRLNLAGKIIIQGDEKQLKKFKLSLIGNTALIGSAYTVSQHKLDAAVEPFLTLDAFLTAILDQMAGATTPKVFTGERVTKAQVDLFASREEESRDAIIGRFLNQFSDFMSTLQKRLCDPSTSEKDAKEMQKRLLEVMTREELTQISNQPVSETVADYTDLERQQIVLIAQEARGNPLYNAKEVERRKLTAQISEEFADAVLLPDEDSTEFTEQTRLQQLELLLLAGQATEVPISPRDNDLVHLQLLMPILEQTAQQTVQDIGGLEVLGVLLGHAEAHYESAIAKGIPKDSIKEIGSTLKKLRKSMAELEKNAQEQVAIEQAAATALQEEIPAPGVPLV